MKLLIVAATKAEIARIYEYYNLPDEQFVSHKNFDVLITGVGMTATAFALGKHLNNNYRLVLNVGIAGSFSKNIALGDLLNIELDIFSELGAEDHDNFIAINELGFGNNTYPATYTFNDFLKVKSITVNKVHGNELSILKTIKRFNPTTESMEGAAVFYACKQLDIPCFQVRSISNYITPRAKETWKLGLAIENLNKWLIDYLIENWNK